MPYSAAYIEPRMDVGFQGDPPVAVAGTAYMRAASSSDARYADMAGKYSVIHMGGCGQGHMA